MYPNRLNMTEKSNDPLNFWQELKRRKVVRVITVYAASAFVILELVDIIAEPLKLPSWLLPVVIVLLSIGFIIAVILSWVYDIHPEGGMVKTEPANEVQEETMPKSSSGWKIASYISFVVIVGLIVLNIIPRSGKKEIQDKSIAVLPFKYLSDEPDKQYLADGTMDAILLHLSKIKDLRVMSRTSVEQYRGTKKTVMDICNELDVGYLLEGSFQKSGDQVRLIVQLIQTGIEEHVWANNYDREWKDIFAVQSEVAKAIARELHAVITPKEIQLIEKQPTENLTAYDLYLRANEELNHYKENRRNNNSLVRASLLYQLSIKYDSSFAEAYIGLAKAYEAEYFEKSYFDMNFLDSTLTLANIALSYDSTLEEAYVEKGNYYLNNGMLDEAFAQYELALNYNPNHWEAYRAKARIYALTRSDFVKYVENFYKAIKVYRGNELPRLLRNLGSSFASLKMYDMAEEYFEIALSIDNDSSKYYDNLISEDFNYEKGKEIFQRRIEYANRRLEIDSTLDYSYYIAYAHSVLGNHKEAFPYYLEAGQYLNEVGYEGIDNLHRLGYGFWQAGYEKEAMEYFDKQIYHCTESIKLGRPYAKRMGAYYDLAGCYAFLGDKSNAYKYLEEFIDKLNYFVSYWFTLILYDPMFNEIRDEEEFQNIIKLMEKKDQAERNRVKAWLIENKLEL